MLLRIAKAGAFSRTPEISKSSLMASDGYLNVYWITSGFETSLYKRKALTNVLPGTTTPLGTIFEKSTDSYSYYYF
jgi:hypothetical protein